MKLQSHPDPWMCMPLSFAIALGVPVQTLLQKIGHNGGEILYPNLPEPARRRGFHIQELIHVALQIRYAVTPVELASVLEIYDKWHVIGTAKDNWNRFNSTVTTSRGVITGQGVRFGHAVAYDRGTIYDPKGTIYSYQEYEAHNFYPRCAWRIDFIGGQL